jgi:hypothetical protein
METDLLISERSIVPVGEIAREERVSAAAVMSSARRLGIEVNRSATLRKRVTPAEAARISTDLRRRRSARLP